MFDLLQATIDDLNLIFDPAGIVAQTGGFLSLRGRLKEFGHMLALLIQPDLYTLKNIKTHEMYFPV